jgi:fructosamine-3-kinase
LKEQLAAENADDRTSYTAKKGAFVESVTDIAVKAQRGRAMRRPEGLRPTQAQATALLGHWLGGRVTCQVIGPLHGGICSAVYRLLFDRPPYSAVVKLQDNPEDDPLPRERVRLDYLHESTNVPCPRVYLQDASGTVVPHSFLLLECIPGVTLGSAHLDPEGRMTVERELAEVLLQLHSHKRDTFGDFAQEAGARDWIDVFLPRLEEIRRDVAGLLPPAILEEVDQALPMAEDALRARGEPTLVHNDLSPGNIMVEQRSDGWHLSGLLDPVGLQYADVEMELSYLQAFDTVGQAFFNAYAASQPLRPGYEFRRLFYWLHTYMVHVWLGFGGEFDDRILAASRQALTLGEKGAPDE